MNREGAASLTGTNAGGGLLGLGSAACSARARKEERGGKIGLGDRNGSGELKRRWVSPARRRVASPALHAVAVAKTRGTVPSLSVFDQILTVQNSEFHIGTRISVKIEVAEDKMTYKFVFGHHLF